MSQGIVKNRSYSAATQPDVSDLEATYLLEALESGVLESGGPFTTRVATDLANDLGCADVILTTSGTDALELAALLLDLGPGDTVILPSFTFPSVATSFARTGASLRFADIERETLGIDPRSVSDLLDDSVRAIVPVHYGGEACDLDGLRNLLMGSSIKLVEDNAHGLYGTFQGKALGTFGPLGATSFHSTKTLTCGEGGALLINDPDFVERAHVLADKGTDRRAFLRGLIDKYTWRDIGSSFILAEPLAAILAAQLDRRKELFEKRRHLAALYDAALGAEVGQLPLYLPGHRAGCVPVPHLFYVLMETETLRDKVLTELRSDGIACTFHYLPLHIAPAAARFADRDTPCPVATEVSETLLRLPFHTGMSDKSAYFVVDRLIAAVKRNA